MTLLFGWCLPGSSKEQHKACKTKIKNSKGETIKCPCPHHLTRKRK